jgi:A/G-specific adenine glycosylase
LFFRQNSENMAQTPLFSLQIQKWYTENHRDLPWRHTQSPYFIWLSEVILQQTRVDQGLAYYHKFCSLFPTITDLARASEQEVLSAWQGLGYYSRARNLHKTAQFVEAHHQGKFPNTYAALIQLPGIGPYTAAAIASFAFREPKAVVDGNVYRVLSRYLGINTPIDTTPGKKLFQQLAEELLDNTHPDRHNQAIMEFGAMQCTPKNPNCSACPLSESCLSYAANSVMNYPVKARKTAVRARYFHYLIGPEKDVILLQQRTGKDIWENMYQLPLIESEVEPELLRSLNAEKISTTTHQLSHQKIYATFWQSPSSLNPGEFQNSQSVAREAIGDFPLPRLIDRFLEDWLD